MAIEDEIRAIRQEMDHKLTRIEQQFAHSGPRSGPAFKGRELVLGEVFDPETHYCADYYADGEGLLYTERDGSKRVYKGPARDWEGFGIIADIIYGLVPPPRPPLLSLGCGYGYDVLRFVCRGWDAYGIDLSEHAVSESPAARRVVCGDVKNPEHLEQLPAIGVVTAFDFWEHIWHDALPGLLSGLHEVLLPGALLFNVICTRAEWEEDYTFQPGVRFSKDNSFLLCSGHVTMRTWQWWHDEFEVYGFEPRLDLAYRFQVARQSLPGFAEGTPAWSPRHLVVVERV